MPTRQIRLCLLAGTMVLNAVGFCAPAKAADRAESPLPFTGVTLAGGDFYTPKENVPGVFNKDFTYPTDAEAAYFSAHGMNIVRIPFMWETLQPKLSQPFLPVEFASLQDIVHTMRNHGLTVLLDPHNYARHYGKIIGGPAVGIADFADFWTQLSAPFKDDDHVWFGLMNEPHDLPAPQWLRAANAAIAAIRAGGSHNMILVPGIAWTGAQSWISSGNARTMLGIVDPDNHYLIEVHQYLDDDCSGTHPVVSVPNAGSDRLREFTEWCQEHHRRAFLGEFAAAAGERGHHAIDDMLQFMQANPDVWVGFTWWAAGPWWHDYMFSIEPTPDGHDREQMTWLQPYLQHH